jgi:hypothetical protein
MSNIGSKENKLVPVKGYRSFCLAHYWFNGPSRSIGISFRKIGQSPARYRLKKLSQEADHVSTLVFLHYFIRLFAERI